MNLIDQPARSEERALPTPQRLTVLHLITGLQAAGAENQLRQLGPASDQRRVRHIVVSLVPGGELEPEFKTPGAEIHSLGLKRGSVSFSGLTRLFRILRRVRPDVLHCWMYHSCALGAIAARLARIPLIWGLRSAHADLRDYRFMTRRVIELCAWMSSWPQAIVVNSQTAREAHRFLGYTTARMKLIPNGIDTRKFTTDPVSRAGVRQELGVGSDTLLIGMFSRYDPMKDHATFLRAVAMLRRRHPELRLVLAGMGIVKDNAALIALLRENQLEDAVFLLGPRRDIARLNAALDVACLSSWTESFPNVVVEAMACGVPCVVTDAGDSAFIVGDTGLVAPVRNPEALAAALESLLSMRAAERIALGQKARERVLARFTMEQCARAYGALYEELAGTLPGTSLTATRSGAV